MTGTLADATVGHHAIWLTPIYLTCAALQFAAGDSPASSNCGGTLLESIVELAHFASPGWLESEQRDRAPFSERAESWLRQWRQTPAGELTRERERIRRAARVQRGAFWLAAARVRVFWPVVLGLWLLIFQALWTGLAADLGASHQLAALTLLFIVFGLLTRWGIVGAESTYRRWRAVHAVLACDVAELAWCLRWLDDLVTPTNAP